ncbi:hypothetical protein TrST_g2337 [Triparma strigata]|uniref:Uncharacterized protein n=1 Tax=Triparma strigata TaxID=1606541 RepID=A0A9W7DVB8_9STRA|nr:hypothetical protein TrST_g2337 [Triparma strigata]
MLLLISLLALLPSVSAVGGRGQACTLCPDPDDANRTAYDQWLASKDDDWKDIHKNDVCIWNEPGCVCGSIGETCISDYGIAFDIFLVVCGALFLYEFVFSFRMSLNAFANMAAADSKKKAKGYSPMDKIMFMCATGCLLRFFWVFTIAGGRRAEDLLLGIQGETILVKVAQILWNCCYLYLVLVWSKLLEQASSMKKSDAKAEKAMEKKVGMAVMFLMAFLIPLYITASLVMPALRMLGDMFQVFIGVYLVIKAKKFGNSLSTVMSGVASAQPLVETIQTTIRTAIFGTVIIFAVVFFNFWAQANSGTPWWNYTYWWCIHVLGEGSLVHALLNTKRSQESKKIASAKSGASTASVAPSSTSSASSAE